MVPLQFGGPETWFVLLVFALVSVPVFVAVVAFVSRAAGSDDDADVEERLAELERRVEALESED